VATIGDLEHRTLALGRVVSVAIDRKAEEVLAEAKKMAKKLAKTSEWRIQALLAPILFDLNERQEAMRLAEAVVRQDIDPAQDNTVTFPKPDTPPPPPRTAKERFVAMARRTGGKSGRRSLRTEI